MFPSYPCSKQAFPPGMHAVAVIESSSTLVTLLMVCDLFCAVSACMCCLQLRDWLMEKDVVKVMKKGKRGKGYKYSKLPKDVSTSMKTLE